MEKRYENTLNNLKRADSSYLPYVGVGGSYQFNDPRRVLGTEGESWYASAFLRWNLFDGAGRESNARRHTIRWPKHRSI